jgi:hypothetical protein
MDSEKTYRSGQYSRHQIGASSFSDERGNRSDQARGLAKFAEWKVNLCGITGALINPSPSYGPHLFRSPRRQDHITLYGAYPVGQSDKHCYEPSRSKPR